MAESLIAQNFGKFVRLFSPSETGGVLNVLFKPVQTQNGTLLDMNSLTMDTLIPYAKQMFLSTKQSYPVLEVLPADLQPAEVKNSTYLIQIILLGVAFLITLGMVFGVLIIPCTWCCRKKRNSDKGTSKVCYIVMGAVTGAFLVFLILCLPLVFVSITSLASAIDGNSTKTDNRGLKETFAIVVEQTSEFLQQLPVKGRATTNQLINYAQDSLQSSLKELITKLLQRLLTEYGAKQLMDEADILKKNVTTLEQIADNLVKAQDATVNEVTAFQNKMKDHKKNLLDNLNKICAKPLHPPDCDQIKKDIENNFKFEFDASKLSLDGSKTLTDMVTMFSGNLTQVLTKFSEMQQNVDNEIEKIIADIQAQFNLTKELGSLINLWDNVKNDVSDPVIAQLNNMKPTVDSTLNTASKYIKLGGYAVLAVFSVVLLILLINGIIIVVQAALKRSPSSKAVTCQMVCGLIIPAIFCFLVPLLVLVGGAVILVTGLISNEGCRYIGDPNGVAITDGATNLYLEYTWPTVFDQHLDPSLRALVDIPIPRNVLDGLLEKCKISSAAPSPGFLPSIGVDHILNSTAALDQPQLKTAINDAENLLVQKVTDLNFGNMLNFNMKDIKDVIAEVSKLLNGFNFQQTIDELKKASVDPEPIKKQLDELEKMTQQLPSSSPEKTSIENTIKDMRNDLQQTPSLDKKIQELIQALEALQQFSKFPDELTKFATSLEKVYTVLTDKNELEKPIRPAFQASVKTAMGDLVTVLDRASTQFTTEVITCGNINKVASSVIGATCANDGLINRFGAFFFMLLLFLCPLELTVILFQVFVKMHGTMTAT